MLETDFVVSVITGRQWKKMKVIGDKEDKNLLSNDRTSHIIYCVVGWEGVYHNSLLVLSEFHIMNSSPSQLPFTQYLPLTPCIIPPKKPPQWTEKRKHLAPPSFPSCQHLFIHASDMGSCVVSFSIPCCPVSPTWKCSLQWVIGVIQGLWPLTHNHHWTLTEIPLRYPAVALCHGDPAAP